jgi:2-haloacid dehalogenase
MQAIETPHAIVFDAYGTLLDVSSISAACADYWPEHASALVQLWRLRQLEYSWQLGLMQRYLDFEQVTGQALDYACGALGLALASQQRAQLLQSYARLQPFPEVLPVLERFSDRRLAVLSNGAPSMLRVGLMHAGIVPHLETILSANVVATFKPSPSVYALATTYFACHPHEILFVSANGWDIAGAGAFGMRTCWLNRTGTIHERIGQPPHLIVADLNELAQRLLV